MQESAAEAPSSSIEQSGSSSSIRPSPSLSSPSTHSSPSSTGQTGPPPPSAVSAVMNCNVALLTPAVGSKSSGKQAAQSGSSAHLPIHHHLHSHHQSSLFQSLEQCLHFEAGYSHRRRLVGILHWQYRLTPSCCNNHPVSTYI